MRRLESFVFVSFRFNACADEIHNDIDFDDWCTTQVFFFAYLDSI